MSFKFLIPFCRLRPILMIPYNSVIPLSSLYFSGYLKKNSWGFGGKDSAPGQSSFPRPLGRSFVGYLQDPLGDRFWAISQTPWEILISMEMLIFWGYLPDPLGDGFGAISQTPWEMDLGLSLWRNGFCVVVVVFGCVLVVCFKAVCFGCA